MVVFFAEISDSNDENSSVIILNESDTKRRDSVEEIDEEEEQEEEKDEVETDNPYLAVINDIRRTEFGINVSLSAEGQKLMEKQQERQGRSLDRLSDELYRYVLVCSLREHDLYPPTDTISGKIPDEACPFRSLNRIHTLLERQIKMETM